MRALDEALKIEILNPLPDCRGELGRYKRNRRVARAVADEVIEMVDLLYNRRHEEIAQHGENERHLKERQQTGEATALELEQLHIVIYQRVEQICNHTRQSKRQQHIAQIIDKQPGAHSDGHTRKDAYYPVKCKWT